MAASARGGSFGRIEVQDVSVLEREAADRAVFEARTVFRRERCEAFLRTGMHHRTRMPRRFYKQEKK